MDNKGWEMSDMLWFLVVFGIALMVVAILYVTNFKNIGNESDNNLNKGNIEVTKPTLAPKEEKEETNDDSTKAEFTYEEAIDLLKSAAIDYVKEFHSDSSVSEVIIKSSDLERESLIPEIYDYKEPSNKCKGYVVYKSEGNDYQVYLRCGNNYVTAGYDDNLAR